MEENDTARGPGDGTQSAPAHAAGPGSGTPAPDSQLTPSAQEAADRVITGLQDLSNHIFDVGEAGLEEALKIVDRAQTEVSKLLSTLTGLVAGKIGSPRG